MIVFFIVIFLGLVNIGFLRQKYEKHLARPFHFHKKTSQIHKKPKFQHFLGKTADFSGLFFCDIRDIRDTLFLSVCAVSCWRRRCYRVRHRGDDIAIAALGPIRWRERTRHEKFQFFPSSLYVDTHVSTSPMSVMSVQNVLRAAAEPLQSP